MTRAGEDAPPPRRPRPEAKPDLAMRLLRLATSGYAGVAARTRTRAVVAVNRDVDLIVSRTAPEAADVIGVTLCAADGGELPEWTPGSHIDLILPSGRMRQYSLCGDPDDRLSYRIAVRRLDAGGGGSLEVHALRAGTAVRARGPRNAFPFAYPHLARRDIRRVEFIAGGIGITALLPMVRAAAASDTPWGLTQIGRNAATIPFGAEIAALGGGNVRVLHGRRPIPEVLANVGPQTSVYFCGPPAFLGDVRAALDSHEHAGFHFERFSPPPVVDGRPFIVHLEKSGLDVQIPADRSALAAIRDVLPTVPYSCQQGFCGTCRATVLEGRVTRKGTARFLDRPGAMLVCVDRCEGGELTLDL